MTKESQTLSTSIHHWLQTLEPSKRKDHADAPASQGCQRTCQLRKETPPNSTRPITRQKDQVYDTSDECNSDPSECLALETGKYLESRQEASSKRCQDELNPYAKRPRRKTREDKYVLQENRLKRARKSADHQTQRKVKTRKRQETAGATLLHRYNAENVISDRLTLRPMSNLGLFNKGKASSPFKQKAITDLAFSKINFSTQSRHHQQDQSSATLDDRRKCKARLQDDEASRFFSAPHPKSSAEKQLLKNLEDIFSTPVECSSGNSTTNPVPIDLDVPLFLGFGQRAQTQCTSKAKVILSSQEGETSSTLSLKHGSGVSWSHSPTTPRTRLKRAGGENICQHARQLKMTDSNPCDEAMLQTRESNHHQTQIPSDSHAQTLQDAPIDLVQEFACLVRKWKKQQEADVPPDSHKFREQAEKVVGEKPITSKGSSEKLTTHIPVEIRPKPWHIPVESATQTEEFNKPAESEQVVQSEVDDARLRAPLDHQSLEKAKTQSTSLGIKGFPRRGASFGVLPISFDSAAPGQSFPLFSAPQTSIYEQQIRQSTAEQLGSEIDFDSPVGSMAYPSSRASFLSPPLTNPTSLFSHGPIHAWYRTSRHTPLAPHVNMNHTSRYWERGRPSSRVSALSCAQLRDDQASCSLMDCSLPQDSPFLSQAATSPLQIPGIDTMQLITLSRADDHDRHPSDGPSLEEDGILGQQQPDEMRFIQRRQDQAKSETINTAIAQPTNFWTPQRLN